MDKLDFDARYTVDSMPGVAFALLRYATSEVETEYREVDDEGETSYFYDTEEVADHGMVVAVMVGDDYEHIVDVDDLTELAEDDYCGGCGQTGCGW